MHIFEHLLSFKCVTYISRLSVTPDVAQKGPILFNKILSCFLKIIDHKTTRHAAEAWAEERTLTSRCTQKQSLHPPPAHGTKRSGHNRNLNTRMLSEAECPLSRKIPCWCPFSINGQVSRSSSSTYPTSTSSLSTHHSPLKTLKLVQQPRWIWGAIRSPIFLDGVFSINKQRFPYYRLWRFEFWPFQVSGTLNWVWVTLIIPQIPRGRHDKNQMNSHLRLNSLRHREDLITCLTSPNY